MPAGERELDNLKEENDQLKARLNDEMAMGAHSRLVAEQREEELLRVKAELKLLQESRDRDIEIVRNEAETADSLSQHKIRTMTMRLQRAEDEDKSAAVLRDQNKSLTQALLALQQDLDRRREAHRDEVAELQDSLFQHRRLLEKEFRNRLNDVSSKAKEEATAGLGADHRRAVEFAQKLLKRFDETGQQVEAMLQHYQTLEQQHKQLQMERGMYAQKQDLQAEEAVSLKRSLTAERSKRSVAEAKLRDARVEGKLIVQLQQHVETIQGELADTRKRLEDTTLRARKFEFLYKKEVQRNSKFGKSKGPAAGSATNRVAVSPDILKISRVNVDMVSTTTDLLNITDEDYETVFRENDGDFGLKTSALTASQLSLSPGSLSPTPANSRQSSRPASRGSLLPAATAMYGAGSSESHGMEAMSPPSSGQHDFSNIWSAAWAKNRDAQDPTLKRLAGGGVKVQHSSRSRAKSALGMRTAATTGGGINVLSRSATQGGLLGSAVASKKRAASAMGHRS